MDDWCSDCIYNIGVCACTKQCENASRKVPYNEEEE